MLGPSYGEWWNERPISARARIALVVLPFVLVALWVLLALDRRVDTDAFFAAVERGDIDTVRSFLDADASPSGRHRDGSTLLDWAVEFGHGEIAHALIEAGADVDAVDHQGVAPLHRAASRGHLAIVELLLRSGANPSVHSERYGSPLHWAAQVGSVPITRMLLDRGAEVDRGDYSRRTPLHYAVLLRRWAVAEILRSHGADLDAMSSDNRSLLHSAAAESWPEVARFLVARGADIDARDGKGNTALHHAARHGSLEVLALLIDGGADVNAATPVLRVTSVHLAARHGHVDAVRLLVANDADLNAQSTLYGTPLHWAADSGERGVAEVLLENGASPHAVDNHRLTAVERANENGHTDLVALLEAQEQAETTTVGEVLSTPLEGQAGADCVFPRQMHHASRLFLDAYAVGELSLAEFRRQFSLPNSEYLGLGKCLGGLHE
jgi:cytohesin